MEIKMIYIVVCMEQESFGRGIGDIASYIRTISHINAKKMYTLPIKY
jgi:hypothetical protein